MATLITKYSEAVGRVPTAAQLQKGELAINIADAIIYTKNANGDVVAVGRGERVPVATATVAGISSFPVSGGLTVSATGAVSIDQSKLPPPPVRTVNGQTGDVVIPAYVLPVASATVRGGARVGDGLKMTDDVLSVDIGSLPTSSVLTVNGQTGNVVLSSTDIINGVVTVNGIAPDLSGNVIIPPYTLPNATKTVKGGVIVGEGLDVTAGKIRLDDITKNALENANNAVQASRHIYTENGLVGGGNLSSDLILGLDPDVSASIDQVIDSMKLSRTWKVGSTTADATWFKAARMKGDPNDRATIIVTSGGRGHSQGAENTAVFGVMSLTKGNVVGAEPERDSLAVQYLTTSANSSISGIHIEPVGTDGTTWNLWILVRNNSKIVMSYTGDFTELTTFTDETSADRPTTGYDKAGSMSLFVTSTDPTPLGEAAYRNVWDQTTAVNGTIADVNNVNRARLHYHGSYIPSTGRDVNLDDDAEDFYGLVSQLRLKSDYLDITGVDVGAFMWINLQRQYVSTRLQFLYGYGRNEIFFRSRRESNSTLPFARIWHSQNLPAQTSTHDATRGVVQKVGAFGIGSSSALAEVDVFPGASLNDENIPSGMYYINSNTNDRPSTNSGTVFHRQIGSTGAQIVITSLGEMFYRGRTSGTWGTWAKVGEGAGTVKSVNSILPDTDGDVALPMQTSTLDDVPGKFLTVGAFGMGGSDNMARAEFPASALSDKVPTGIYVVPPDVLDRPDDSTTSRSTLWHHSLSGIYSTQLLITGRGNVYFRINVSGQQLTWKKIMIDADLNNKVDKTTKVTASTGLWGGGNLSASRVIGLNIASNTTLGGVKIGDSLSVDSGGKIDVGHAVVNLSTTVSAELLAFNSGSYIRSQGGSNVKINVGATTDTTPSEWHFRQAGAGSVTLEASTGVTIHPPYGGTFTTIGTGATMTLKRVGENEYDLFGQLTSL